MREARSYIVRVYGRKANGHLQGTVELVSTGDRQALASAEQLWAIVSRADRQRTMQRRSPKK